MADWLASMQQSYEFYTVDPNTWMDRDRLTNIKSCRIERDADTETLASASISMTELVGESYIRVYLVTIQNGVRERHPLGTFLIQTPTSTFDGKIRDITVDAYSPLLELKEKLPPLGYSVMKGELIIQRVYKLTKENVRAPVTNTLPASTTALYNDFVANVDDTWIRFLTDLLANAECKFDIDPMGNILFAPEQETAALQPVWTYNDDNSSILLPSMSMSHDLFNVPNVVEVIYSDDNGSLYAKVVNDDPESPTSTVNRGREIIHRVTDPSRVGIPTESYLYEYAERLLKEFSSVDYTVTYTHGYCPVRVGDCVRLNYTRAGLNGVKAKVVAQSIDCTAGCKVTETAVFTTKLWR